jgi:hypothetical protein
MRAVNGFDFAVFIFSPDDLVVMREKSHLSVRDNVLFELGMFIGHLGRQRSFFVVPEGEDQLHLPSDLSGIAPAKYDPKNANIQAAVAPAQFEISRAIEAMGPLHGQKENTLYDGLQQAHYRNLRGLESHIYKGNERVGEKAQGSLSVAAGGLLAISRDNAAGRFEIQLRPSGPGKPSFAKSSAPPPPRILHVSCAVKAEAATHSLRFVFKDEEGEKWLGSESKRIQPGDWVSLDLYFWIDSTKDFLFRIDDEDVTAAPSKLLIRDLSITEEDRGQNQP